MTATLLTIAMKKNLTKTCSVTLPMKKISPLQTWKLSLQNSIHLPAKTSWLHKTSCSTQLSPWLKVFFSARAPTKIYPVSRLESWKLCEYWEISRIYEKKVSEERNTLKDLSMILRHITHTTHTWLGNSWKCFQLRRYSPRSLFACRLKFSRQLNSLKRMKFPDLYSSEQTLSKQPDENLSTRSPPEASISNLQGNGPTLVSKSLNLQCPSALLPNTLRGTIFSNQHPHFFQSWPWILNLKNGSSIWRLRPAEKQRTFLN